MGQIVAIASPKGGVGKSTEAINQPAIFAAHQPGIRQLVVDADDNRTAADCLRRCPERALPGVDVDTLDDPSALAKLRRIRDRGLYDLIWVDLPGAKKTGELEAILRGDREEPVPDLVIMPMKPSTFDLRVVVRAVRHDIASAGVDYGVLLTMVNSQALNAAIGWRNQLEGMNISTFSTLVREYSDYQHATAEDLPINHYGGKRAYARKAEDDQRALAREIARRLNIDITIPTREQEAGLSHA